MSVEDFKAKLSRAQLMDEVKNTNGKSLEAWANLIRYDAIIASLTNSLEQWKSVDRLSSQAYTTNKDVVKKFPREYISITLDQARAQLHLVNAHSAKTVVRAIASLPESKSCWNFYKFLAVLEAHQGSRSAILRVLKTCEMNHGDNPEYKELISLANREDGCKLTAAISLDDLHHPLLDRDYSILLSSPSSTGILDAHNQSMNSVSSLDSLSSLNVTTSKSILGRGPRTMIPLNNSKPVASISELQKIPPSISQTKQSERIESDNSVLLQQDCITKLNLNNSINYSTPDEDMASQAMINSLITDESDVYHDDGELPELGLSMSCLPATTPLDLTSMISSPSSSTLATTANSSGSSYNTQAAQSHSIAPVRFSHTMGLSSTMTYTGVFPGVPTKIPSQMNDSSFEDSFDEDAQQANMQKLNSKSNDYTSRAVNSMVTQKSTGLAAPSSVSPHQSLIHQHSPSSGSSQVIHQPSTQFAPSEHVEKNNGALISTDQSPQAVYPPSIFSDMLQQQEVIYVKGTPYLRLNSIGKGGSSRVYRVMGPDLQILALKKVRLPRGDPSAAQPYQNEIDLMQKLKGSRHIVRIIDSEIDLSNRNVHIVMEAGSADLNSLLSSEKDIQSAKFEKMSKEDKALAPPCQLHIDINVLRLLWQQMLISVETIHEARIVHGDLKPANFIVVDGIIKLIDFGIAKTIGNDTTNIMRDSQIGTINYMSPEAIVGNNNMSINDGSSQKAFSSSQGQGMALKLGRQSDIWSLGCILYQMTYGRPPFADLSLIQKLHAICDASYEISYPDVGNSELVEVMKLCLTRNPAQRPSISGPSGLLEHPFLHPERIAPMKGNNVENTLSKELVQAMLKSSLLAVFNAVTDTSSAAAQLLRGFAASSPADFSDSLSSGLLNRLEEEVEDARTDSKNHDTATMSFFSLLNLDEAMADELRASVKAFAKDIAKKRVQSSQNIPQLQGGSRPVLSNASLGKPLHYQGGNENIALQPNGSSKENLYGKSAHRNEYMENIRPESMF